MRKFKFLALAFAAFSFAACSDDVLDGKGGNSGIVGDGTPAYLTVTFSANAGSSSRADGVVDGEGTNTGDHDGNAENSGHQNAGTTDETKVVTALVVVVPDDDETQGTGFAKYYSATSASNGGNDVNTSETEDPDAALTVINDQTKTYSTDAPIEIGATEIGIDYKVLVVVNPVESLISSYTTGTTNIYTGITNVATAREIYETITTGAFTSTTNTGVGAYADAAAELGNTTNGFMMANKAENIVKVTTAHTPDNPAKTENLDVERVLSKITFRPNMTGTGEDEKPNYVYTVETGIGDQRFKANLEDGVYDPDDKGAGNNAADFIVVYDTPNKFNEAYDQRGEGNTVWVLYDTNSKFVGVYGKVGTVSGGENDGKSQFKRLSPKTAEEYEALTENKDDYYVAIKTQEEGEEQATYKEASSITLVGEMETVSTSTFYVRLDGYALTNLSKSVNYVRHTIGYNALDGTEVPFGTVESQYLWTPGWGAKNAVEFTQDGGFPDGVNGETWFYNTLANVATESNSLAYNWATATYFKKFATTAENPGTVTGDGDKGQHSSQNQPANLKDIGYLLGYCFENSVEKDQQRHGLTTGISFVATVWKDQSCSEALETLYLYAGNQFTTIRQIVNAYGGSVPEAITKLADKEDAGTALNKAELDAANIVRYEGNQCYYYTNRIKHYDNNDNTSMGEMEFAIMRNNIYSLAVTTISDIGAPFIDPNPGIENETEEAALQIQATILPWIVRYNDIEF